MEKNKNKNRNKNGAFQFIGPQRTLQQIPAPPVLPKVSEWILSHGNFQTAASVVGFRASEILRVEFDFLLPSGFSVPKPHLFSKPDIVSAHLPHAGSLVCGARYGAWTTHSSGKASVVLISLLLVGCHAGSVGLNQTISLSPICLSVAFFPYP